MIQPGYVNTEFLMITWPGGPFGQAADYLKLLEVLLEANLQAITGELFFSQIIVLTFSL